MNNTPSLMLTAEEKAALADLVFCQLAAVVTPGTTLETVTQDDIDGPDFPAVPWEAITAIRKIKAEGIWSPPEEQGTVPGDEWKEG